MFDWVVCINLARRRERWQQFIDGLPADWPFSAPVRFEAIDGISDPIPDWFQPMPRHRPGAWGCYRSHLMIWQEAIDRGYEAVLVLEDDAIFAPDVTVKTERFMAAVPDDWQQLYFGGQHLETNTKPPCSTDGVVARCYNVNRTHCYAMRREMMQAAIAELSVPPSQPARQRDYHVDHRLGRMCSSGRWNVYAPYRFIVGQAGGESDVSGRVQRAKFWNEFPVEGVPELPLCCAASVA